MKQFLFLLTAGVLSVAVIGCANPAGGSSGEQTNNKANASLSGLELSVGILTPEFSPDRLEYTATIDPRFPSVTLTGTAVDENAKLDAKNDKAQILADGINTLEYTVLAKDGVTSRTYKVDVKREADTKPPVITKFTFSPTKADTSQGGVTITGTFVVEDPSGINSVTNIRFVPTGYSSKPQKNEQQSTFTHEVYDFSMHFDKGTLCNESLDMKNLKLYIYDSFNNWTFAESTTLPPDATIAFELYNGSDDHEAPSLISCTMDQSSVSTKESVVEVTGHFTVSDPSGLGYCGISYPLNAEVKSCTRNAVLSSDTVGVYDFTIEIEKGIICNESASIYMRDGVGNKNTIEKVQGSNIVSMIN